MKIEYDTTTETTRRRLLLCGNSRKMLRSGGFLLMSRAFVLALLATALVVAPVKSQASRTKRASVAVHSPAGRGSGTVAVKKTASHSAVLSSSARKRKGRHLAHKPPAPSYQLHPDPERYVQIQQALLARGYLKGQADGAWNDESVDALKRFQTDQKLEADGKINALTLTGLGLGPKHDGTSASSVPLSATSGSAANPPETPLPSELPPGESAPVESTPP